MARIEFEETTSSLKMAAVWGGATLVLFLVKLPLLIAILVSVIIGASNGVANLWLLRKTKPERMTVSNWVGLTALLAAVITLNRAEPQSMGALQCLALGCLCVAARSAVFGFFKASVMEALNRKYEGSLALFDDGEPETQKVYFDDVHQAHQAFLSVLPAGLCEVFRAHHAGDHRETFWASRRSVPIGRGRVARFAGRSVLADVGRDPVGLSTSPNCRFPVCSIRRLAFSNSFTAAMCINNSHGVVTSMIAEAARLCSF